MHALYIICRGYVHPKLHYNETQRQVYLGEKLSSSSCSIQEEEDGKKTSSTTDNFDAGLTLLTIPDACLLTLHTVERDATFGKLLFQVVHSLRRSNNVHDDDTGSCGGLYNDEQDVMLALYLAYLRQRLDDHEQQHDDDTVNNKEEATTSSSLSTPPWLFYKPYLDTLPSSSECHLPRQWSMATLKRCLHGTSLYNRLLKEQSGLLREYELVKVAWLEKYNSTHDDEEDETCTTTTTNNANNNNIFPSFEQYDSMMATLTSRGFCNFGYDNVDALIPMLDLLNHVRGSISSDTILNEDGKEGSERSSITTGPDVRYERFDDINMNADVLPSPKRQRMERAGSGGGVRVSTSHSISTGSALQMTYGAKGNVALLGRYGFCIPNNVEPDGE
ncbi:SET domain-containing protein [bacterium]|nr:SET domain-containing protein [bacterium]